MNRILFSIIIYIVFRFIFLRFKIHYAVIFSLLICIGIESIIFMNGFSPNFLNKISLIKTLLTWKWTKMLFEHPFSINNILAYYIGISSSALLNVIYSNYKTSFNNLNLNKFIFKLSIFIFGIIFFKLTFNNNIEISNYKVGIESLPPNLNGVKVLQISDLHSTVYPKKQNKLIEKIKKISPDLILLTGDIADDVTEFLGTELLLEGIKDIAPIYYATGNHEYWAKDFWEINDKICSFGVVSLEDAIDILTINGQEILIAGFDDPYCYVHKKRKVLTKDRFIELNKSIEFKGLKILISHRPELVDLYAKSQFNLIFSGHAHGGQARIPFTNISLIAPNQGWLPKYTNGLYKINEQAILIVSRGLSINNNLPRIFNRPHLVVVTLESIK